MKKNIFTRFDVPIIAISFAITLAVVIATLLYPAGTISVANTLFVFTTQTLGTPILIFVFVCSLLCIWLYFSKYGNIRLGNQKAEFSTFSYISMMVCSGFGSGTIYWAFLEFSQYLASPMFGLDADSVEIYDYISAYNFHHWGPVAWAIFCIASLPIAYAYHVRKAPTLRVNEICAGFVSEKYSFITSKFVDYVYILSTIAGIAFFVALSVPVIGAILAAILGIENSFALQAGIVVTVSILYTISSYMGVSKGIKRLSDVGIFLLIFFTFSLILFGDTIFIIDQTTTGIAYFFQNVIRMSLYTDAVGEGGFPQNWTVWFWSYWLIYAPFMGVFVSRISKGRTLREVVACMVLGGGFGTGILITAVNAFSMDINFSGTVPVVEMSANGLGEQAIVEMVGTFNLSGIASFLPSVNVGLIFQVILAVCMFLLLATTLDGSSFSLANNSQKDYSQSAEPAKLLRVFWCIVLTLFPLTLIFIEAPVSTLQTCSLAFSIPIIIIMVIMIRAFIKSLNEDFGSMQAAEIIERNAIDFDDDKKLLK